MTFEQLLEQLPLKGLEDLTFPRHLLGAFRRKAITFCTGMTDEKTVVYWFQSKSFTIDLRLSDGIKTPVLERQGWIGDTIWDETGQQLSWNVERSYQPRNQWPEPASLSFIGNCVLEFAPSRAYVEDWRQQSSTGTILGLRLLSMRDEITGQVDRMDGGIIVAGEHVAYVESRAFQVDDALRSVSSLEQALAGGIVSEGEIESYEASIATDGDLITYSTRPERVGKAITSGDFKLENDGSIILSKIIDEVPRQLRFSLDLHLREFAFDGQTATTAEAREWMRRECGHLGRHTSIAR